MDKAAAHFGIDAIEIRRRNIDRSLPLQVRNRTHLRRGELPPTLEMAIEHIDLTSSRAPQKPARAGGRYLGIGFSTFSERTGYGSPAFAARGMDITPGWETSKLRRSWGWLGASARRHTGRACVPRSAQIIADEIGVEPSRIGWCMATPTGRLTAGAPLAQVDH